MLSGYVILDTPVIRRHIIPGIAEELPCATLPDVSKD
jgi:hypothetical protein